MSNLQNTSNIKLNLASHYVDLETFINTFLSLRETFEEMRIIKCELAEVIQEVEATKMEAELLKMAINKTAIEFGLEPILKKDQKS
jgi:hypothetical protein